MPSTSKKQHNFMAAIANSPSFAKKVGVPQSVGKDFTTADKGRKFSKGGDTMASKMNPGFMAMMAKKKAGAKEPKKMNMGGMGGMGYAKGGSASSRADGVATKGKTKGTMIAMKHGGKAC
jgi:hypothetical protein